VVSLARTIVAGFPQRRLGLAYTPPTLFLGFGFEDFDFSLSKDIGIGKETRPTKMALELGRGGMLRCGTHMGANLLEGLAGWWIGFRDEGKRSRLVLAILLVLVCAGVAVVGVPRLRIFGHDIFVSLDGGWRVLNGQRPGVDFYAQMGPAYYLLHAAGLRLAGNDARGLGYGSAMATALISCWAFFLLRGRMKPAPFFIACLFLALLAGAPFPLGFTPVQTAFSMKHNRYAYALTGLVLLESFLPQGESNRRQRFAGAFSTGAACALLLFLKISFGMVAVTLAAAALPFRPGRRFVTTGMLAGFAALSVPMMAYLRFDLGAMVREYRLLAAVKAGGLSAYDIANRIYFDRHEIAPIALMAVLLMLLPGIPARRGFALLLAVTMATLAGTLLMLTNTQPWGLPLLGMAALLLVNEVTATVPKGAPRAYVAPLVAMGLMSVGISMALDAAGIVTAMRDKAWGEKPGYRFQEAHMASIQFVDCPEPVLNAWCSMNDNGKNFVGYTEEGLHLVRENARPGESVRGMGMSNPFSYGSLRAPSHGGAVTLCGTDCSRTVMPPKELLLGDVALVLLPKFPATDRETLGLILKAYPELLKTDYYEVAQSVNWILYRRNP
jgi:hypothetical protein